MSKPFLVTGASGFLGGWLVKSLAQQGPVRLLARKPESLTDLLQDLNKMNLDQQVESISLGDVTDKDSVMKACEGAAAVFHLAGLIAYKPSARQSMFAINVDGTRNVLEASLNYQLDFQYVSSVVAVGAGKTPQVLDEDSVFDLQGRNFGYFDSKKAAEDLMLTEARKKRIRIGITNPSTVYGPGDAKKGSRRMQVKAAQGRLPFVPSQGGVNVVSVHDVVSGILQVWKQGIAGERYILASENLSLQQLFQQIATSAQVAPPRLVVPGSVIRGLGKLNDFASSHFRQVPSLMSYENACVATLYHWFSSEKAQKHLGWKPRPANEAIAESVAWMKEHGIA